MKTEPSDVTQLALDELAPVFHDLKKKVDRLGRRVNNIGVKEIREEYDDLYKAQENLFKSAMNLTRVVIAIEISMVGGDSYD